MSISVHSTPTPLTQALIRLGPLIHAIRQAEEIVSWRRSWYGSWVMLAGWWAVCLGARTSLLGLLVGGWLLYRRKPEGLGVGTEESVQKTVDELLVIERLIPSPPNVMMNSRAAAFLAVIWLSVSLLVPSRILIGIVGTIFLSLRAPWFNYLCHTVWRSAFVRWTLYSIWARITGVPLPSHRVTVSIAQEATPTPDRFLFTIYENQRWWMALDWTAALLPAERPSWSSAPPASLPVSPPAAFALPEGWSWEEPEWSVVVKANQDEEAERVGRPLPSAREEDQGLIVKAAGRVRETHERTLSVDKVDTPKDKPKEKEKEDDHDEDPQEEPLTDADGWVYGDNKWEARGNKGGMGKVRMPSLFVLTLTPL